MLIEFDASGTVLIEMFKIIRLLFKFIENEALSALYC